MKVIASGSLVLGLVLMFLAMVEGAEPMEEVVDLGKGVKLEMVLIPAKKFKMGSSREAVEIALKGDSFFKDLVRDKEEAEVTKIVEGLVESERQHDVTLTKSFYMGKYEVTNEQWDSVMFVNRGDKKGANLPVTNVSWTDCQEFIKKLNSKGKGGYRLPTEAEWEYACRAGTTTEYSFGDNITPKDANWNHNFISIKELANQYQQGKVKPLPVGTYVPNAFGLYDMHGNVWEWCQDWYGPYPRGFVEDPKGPESGKVRVLRGGSFGFNAWLARSADRSSVSSPEVRNLVVVGFRLVRTQ